MKHTHAVWDDGAVTGEAQLLGQKTVKTKCGKRVIFARVSTDRLDIDCSDCRMVMADEEHGRALIDHHCRLEK